MGHWHLQGLQLSAHHHEDYQACPKGTALHCLAHWALTEAVCETHVFVDRFIVPLCAINNVFCIIFD